jgi:hypothetical protein
MQKGAIAFAPNRLNDFCDGGFFMDHLIVIDAIANPLNFGFCFSSLGDNS